MKLEDRYDPCQYDYRSFVEIASPDPRRYLRLRRVWWIAKKYWWYGSVVGPREFMRRFFPATRLGRFILREERSARTGKSTTHSIHSESPTLSNPPASTTPTQPLNLKVGDWVSIKSEKEIFATLDEHGKHNGLIFSKEQRQFCGKRFRVFKVLDMICLETTGELRKIKSPTVLLEGVICDGSAHGGCTRSCFLFWREDWLLRSAPDFAQDSKPENQ